MRVVVAAGIAGDFGAFEVLARGAEIQVVHGDQNPPLRGFEPVADIGQSPVHDGAHGVREIAVLQLLLDLQVFNPVGRRGGFRHKSRLVSSVKSRVELELNFRGLGGKNRIGVRGGSAVRSHQAIAFFIQMQTRGGGRHRIRPQAVSPTSPGTPPPSSTSPNRPVGERENDIFLGARISGIRASDWQTASTFLARTVRGSRKWRRGCRGGGGTAWGLMGFRLLPCIALAFQSPLPNLLGLNGASICKYGWTRGWPLMNSGRPIRWLARIGTNFATSGGRRLRRRGRIAGRL